MHILVHLDNATYGGSERTIEPILELRHRGFTFTITYRQSETFVVPRAWQDMSGVIVRPLDLNWFPGWRNWQFRHFGQTSWSRRLVQFLAYISRRRRDAQTLKRVLNEVNPDVVHIVMGGFPGARSSRLSSLVAGKGWSIPRVISIHNVPVKAPWFWQLVEGRMSRRALRAADVITFGSKRAARHLTALYPGLDGKIRVIPNTNPDEKLCEVFLTGRALDEDYWCVSVARLEANKGTEVLLRSLADVRLRQPELVSERKMLLVVGSGSRLESLQRLSCSLGLNTEVEFAGSTRNYYEQVARASIYVQPSLWGEDSPLATLAAMQLGKPLVVSNVGGLGDQVSQDCGFVVAPGDEVRLSKAVESLIRDTSLRDGMRHCAMVRYRTVYSNAQYQKVWQRTYSTAVTSDSMCSGEAYDQG